MQRVTKGIIPAAGLGTRLHPITRVIPKEMFPINQKPIIHYIVEEAITAGLIELAIVLRPGKELIREYLSTLQDEELAGKIHIEYIYQPEPIGLGDAILRARDFVGSEPFTVLLPDDLYMDFNPTRELAIFFNEHQRSCLCIGETAPEHASCYGKISAERIKGNLYRIGYMFPKNWKLNVVNPAARRLSSFGRYVLTPRIFELTYEKQEGVELDDGDLIRGLLRFETVYGLYSSCARFDTGRFSTYVEAVASFHRLRNGKSAIRNPQSAIRNSNAEGEKEMQIPITKPCFTDAEEKAIAQVLRSGWTAQGPKVAEFERKVAEYVGAGYAVATTSCTTALHLSLLALEIGRGDEVIIPSFTFIATANAVRYCGAKPIFVDIDPLTYNIDPNKIEEAMSPKTKAIITVDQVGLPSDLCAIFAIAEKYGVPVIEDAACAIGAEYQGLKVGSHSLLCCFSFHPRKIINTGEGGMVTTSNATLADKIRKLRHHGMSINDLERHRASKVLIEEYPVIGYNYRMTDIQAAIGIEQMNKLDTIIERRRALAGRYNEALSNVKWLEAPYEPKYAKHTYQSYMVRVTEGSPVTRGQLMEYLLTQGIATRRGIMSVHREAPYRKTAARFSLPETERATDQCVILPLYPQMSGVEQDYVLEKIYEALDAPIINRRVDLASNSV